MNHSLAIGPLAAALFLAATGLAAAHAGLTPASAANGSSVRIAITIPHGCDGAPTDTVRIALPEGLVDARPQVKPGWALAITKGDYQKTYNVHGSPVTAGAVAIEWSGGAVPDDAFDEFVIQGTLQGFDAETDLPFIVTQLCGAASVSWDQLAAPGENAHALPHPAPLLKVVPAAAEAHHDPAAAPAPLTIGDLELSGGFTRATLPNAPVGGGYLTIVNKGTTPDRLIAATSPAAGEVQMHEMKMQGDLMKMAELPDGIEIPAGATVTLAPGGLHLMLLQLTGPLVEGAKVPVTLTFEHAGSIEIELTVAGMAARGPAEDHSGHGG